MFPSYIPAKVEVVQHQSYRQGAPKSSRVVYHSFAEWRVADQELYEFLEASQRRIDAAYQRCCDRQRQLAQSYAQSVSEVSHV